MPGRPNPEFLRRAIALATENVTSGRGGPFGAVIVRAGKIVGEGVNTVTATNDPTAHGEVNAIRAAARALGTFLLAGGELYCTVQAGAADAARAVFDDAFLYDEMRKESAARRLPSVQMLRDEAWASFAAWIAA